MHDVGPRLVRESGRSARKATTSVECGLRRIGGRRDAEPPRLPVCARSLRARARSRRRRRRTGRPRGRAPPARRRDRSHAGTGRRAGRERHGRSAARSDLDTGRNSGTPPRPNGRRIEPEIYDVFLKEAFSHGNRIAGTDRENQRHGGRRRPPVDHARDVDAALVAARRKAAGDGDRVLRRHAVDERILPGTADLAEHEERPERLDLDGNLGIAQIAAAQPRLQRRRRVRWS